MRKSSVAVTSCSNAVAWLTTPPISALRLHLEAEELQSCVKHRLGIPLFNVPRKCPNCKKGVIDIYGDHSLTCGGRGDKIHRHDRLRDKVFSSCDCASLSSSLKKRTLASTTNSDLQTYFYSPGHKANRQRSK